MRRVPALLIALLAASPVAPAHADHVSATLHVSARLGERISDNSWAVIVDWRIDCSGPAPGKANYTGSLNLDDLDSGAATYMGGTAGASGSDRQPVGRARLPRRMRPRIKASCFDSGVGNHGSDTTEVTGNQVLVPALGDEDGDGTPDSADGGQGSRDFPRGGFGGPRDPLRSGGCATAVRGTPQPDVLVGSSAADLVLGLGAADLLRGGGGHDCLLGGPGDDRLIGGAGHDRLTGGTGADRLAGGSGVNRYDAGAGNDVVEAANGRAELVSCGSGRDRARVDPGDRVRGCERVTRRRR